MTDPHLPNKVVKDIDNNIKGLLLREQKIKERALALGYLDKEAKTNLKILIDDEAKIFEKYKNERRKFYNK